MIRRMLTAYLDWLDARSVDRALRKIAAGEPTTPHEDVLAQQHKESVNGSPCWTVRVHAYHLDEAAKQALFKRVADGAHDLDEEVFCTGEPCSTCEFEDSGSTGGREPATPSSPAGGTGPATGAGPVPREDADLLAKLAEIGGRTANCEHGYTPFDSCPICDAEMGGAS